MLFNRNKSYDDIVPSLEIKRLILLVRKFSSDVVFNMAKLEGNPFTYPEVQTLLEGVTIVGHKVNSFLVFFLMLVEWLETYTKKFRI